MPSANPQQYDVPPLVEVLSSDIFISQGFEWDTAIYTQSIDICLAGANHNWPYEEVLRRIKLLTGDDDLAAQYIGLNVALALLSDYLEGQGIDVMRLTLAQAQSHYEVFVLECQLNSLDIAKPDQPHPESN